MRLCKLAPLLKVEMWKDNIGNLESTRCNEVWNRISPSVQSPGVQTMRPEPSFSGMPELEFKRSLQKSQGRFTCISDIYGIEEVLGYRDVLEISKFQQVGVDDRETETNHINETPMFDEERED